MKIGMKAKENAKARKPAAMFCALFLCLSLLASCSAGTVAGDSTNTGNTSESTADTQTSGESVAAVSTITEISDLTVEYDSEETAGVSATESESVTLNGDKITYSGIGATIAGRTITITAAGAYSISGTLNDGQIIVDTQDKGTVTLLLSGANITSKTSSPIFIMNAEKTILTLADGTVNQVTDGSSYTLINAESGEPNAAIFSKDDLTINGSGSMIVNANYNDGIACKDDLKIVSGNITVNAVGDGIRGRNYVAIKDGTVTITAGADGIKSNNDEGATKGFVFIEGGKITITSGNDAIQAETSLQITGGDFNLITGGGSVNGVTKQETQGFPGGGHGAKTDATSTATVQSDAADTSAGASTISVVEVAATNTTTTIENESDSAKGLKAGVGIKVTGGTFTIDSADDSIHSNNLIGIDGGTFNLLSGDDGIHADTSIAISNGEFTISKSYEGIESSIITISGGNFHITSSDDAINGAGGVDSSAMGGRPGQSTFTSTGNTSLTVSGGTIYCNAAGDGLDVNGSIYISGGTVLVDGPTEDMNAPVDYDGVLEMTGGLLVAAGSAGMAMAPSDTSTQYSVMITYDSALPANTLTHIQNAAGEDILTFEAAKEYRSIVVCSPELIKGSTYTVYSGGNSAGTNVDGLYTDGSYTAGTEVDHFTVSDMVSYVGTAGGMKDSGQGGPGGGGVPGGVRPGGMPGGGKGGMDNN